MWKRLTVMIKNSPDNRALFHFLPVGVNTVVFFFFLLLFLLFFFFPLFFSPLCCSCLDDQPTLELSAALFWDFSLARITIPLHLSFVPHTFMFYLRQVSGLRRQGVEAASRHCSGVSGDVSSFQRTKIPTLFHFIALWVKMPTRFTERVRHFIMVFNTTKLSVTTLRKQQMTLKMNEFKNIELRSKKKYFKTYRNTAHEYIALDYWNVYTLHIDERIKIRQ